jgi:multiple sugar transport system permease protein
MTHGGPLDSTLSVAFQAYNQFSFGNYAYTAAMAFILFIAIAMLSFVQFRLFRPAT